MAFAVSAMSACAGGLRREEMARCDRRCYVARNPGVPMSAVFSLYLVPLAIGAVGVVLLLGLVNMMRGGSPNTSQRLMRLRVLLQFGAIIVIMITIWLMGR